MASNIRPDTDLSKASLSSIEKDCDSDSSDDGSYVEYVAERFEMCLQDIEKSITWGDFDGLLVRSRIYLNKLKCMHDYMLLPPTEFDEIDDAIRTLLSCTFPAETGITYTPETVWARSFTNEKDMLVYMASEKCLVEALHKNAHVRKLHKCQLPTAWTNEHAL